MTFANFLGPLFTDWASGCYVLCGYIGSNQPDASMSQVDFIGVTIYVFRAVFPSIIRG